MTIAHTPGPWKFVAPSGTMIFTEGVPYGHGEMLVAQVRGWGHLTGGGGGCAFEEEKAIAIQTANARLIAAAPDLYEALSELVEMLRKEAPGTSLNHHTFDALGIKANKAIAKAEGR